MTQVGRIARFAIVGAGVAVLYVALYLVFLKLGLTQSIANAIAFGIAVLVQYAGQAQLTFRRALNDRRQMLRFGVMVLGGFATSELITGIAAVHFMLEPGIAAMIVALILPVQNFILMTLWVFAVPQIRKQI